MTVKVALEIIGNPEDIFASSVGPDKKTGKFSGQIWRADGKNRKLLFSSDPKYFNYIHAEIEMNKLISLVKSKKEEILEDMINSLESLSSR